MIRIARSVALAMMAALVALTVGATAAMAAPAVPWESISLNLGTDGDTPLLLVSGKLPDSVPLPATVELALPAGAEVQWVGEVLGGDPSADPAVEPTKAVRGDQDIYTFTLTKARIGQIEATVPSAVTVVGEVYNVNFSQIAWADAPEYAVAIQIPQAAQLSETPTGTASIAPGPTGFRYYQQTFPKVKAGDPVAVTFSYTLPAGATTGTAAPGSSGGSSMIVPILLALIALAVGAALVVGVRRKMNPIVEGRTARTRSAEVAPAEEIAEAEQVAEAGVFEEDEGLEEDDAVATSPRNRIALYGALAVVAILLVGGGVAVSNGSATRSTQDAITKVLSSGEACTQAKIPVAIPAGTDPVQAADQLFAALATVPSITTATVRLSTSTIEVGYCDSETNEDAIRAALAPTGYVTAGAAPASPTGASAIPSPTL